MTRALRLPAFVALFALSGCGLVPSQGSCDYRPTKAQACEDLLTNRHNQFRNTLETLCTLGGGKYSDALCDHTGALGGCKCEGCENGEAITWFFPGAVSPKDPAVKIETVDDVKKQCEGASRTFVAP